MSHSPAQILSTWIIEQNLAEAFNSSSWPSFIARLPDGPETPVNAIGFFDQQGLKQGRIMKNGEVIDKLGVQIMLRSGNYPDGWSRIKLIQEALDQVKNETLFVDFDYYMIVNCSRTANFIPLGIRDETLRNYFSLNLLLTIRSGINVEQLENAAEA